MSQPIIVIAEAIEEDVLIRFPDELGVQEGQLFEIVRKPNGVVVLTFETCDPVK